MTGERVFDSLPLAGGDKRMPTEFVAEPLLSPAVFGYYEKTP